MPECIDCGEFISSEYKRVLSDRSGAVQCPTCIRSVR